MRMIVALVVALLSARPIPGVGFETPQELPDAAVRKVLADPAFVAAMAAIDRDHERLVSDIIAITEIPAPPFKEVKRSDAMLERFRALGLSDVERDTEGNVLGIRRGTRGSGHSSPCARTWTRCFPKALTSG